MKSQQACVILLCVSVISVWGAVSFDGIKTEQVHGQTVRYCVYKNLRLLPNSIFQDYDDCVKCSCTKSGLECATIQAQITIGDENPKCNVVVIGCKSKFVMKSDQTKACPKHFMPTNISAVGK